MDINKKISDIGEAVDLIGPYPAMVVELLEWFGAKRRGSKVVRVIRETLKLHNLITIPDFASAYIYSEIKLDRPKTASASIGILEESDTVSCTVENPSPPSSISVDDATTCNIETPAIERTPYNDPTYRISKLKAATTTPVSVNRDALLSSAITEMMVHGFSQLPVMEGSRKVKGIISWASIGAKLAHSPDTKKVAECTIPHETRNELKLDDSIFLAINVVLASGYALVRERNEIVGIITSSDLNEQFLRLTEPFLLLGEIESHLRHLIRNKFTGAEINSFIGRDEGKEITEVTDMTFGEYGRLLENPENWNKLGVALDRKKFTTMLDDVRELRNDVMHFDPDGITNDETESLKQCAQFLRRLVQLSII